LGNLDAEAAAVTTMTRADLLRLLDSLPKILEQQNLDAADWAFVENMRLRVAANEPITEGEQEQLARIAQGWSDA
jgi:hypothetical protein